jgi:DNA-binding beta-propeller fold protein YncE
VWTANNGNDSISKIDRATGARRDFALAGDSQPVGIAAALDHIWVANWGTQTVSRVAAGTGVREDIDLAVAGSEKGPARIVVGDGTIWVSNPTDGTVTALTFAM